MRRLVFLSCLAAIAASAQTARAAQATVTLQFSSPTSTSITCTPHYASGQTSFPLPQAAGAVMAVCTVQPNTWLGSLAVSGNTAFGINGTQIVVGPNGYNTAGSVSLTVTATP